MQNQSPNIVETDEEFMNCPIVEGIANYEGASHIVEKVTGKRENVLSEYKKIIANARKSEEERWNKFIEENPGVENVKTVALIPFHENNLMRVDVNGEQFFEYQTLPEKVAK